MSAHRPQHRGTGWIVVSAILLVLAGGNLAINGLFALHANKVVENNVKDSLIFSAGNLDTWGWIYVILGGVIFLAGVAVLARAQWAVFIGMLAAFFGMVMAFFWLFTPYWPDALISIILSGIVIYGLGTYGANDTVAA